MRLHAIVGDAETAWAAVKGGATVVQLRIKSAPTEELVRIGGPLRRLPCLLVINDDVEAALRLGAAGVHLGTDDRGVERAVVAGLMVGLSAGTVAEAVEAGRRGAAYLGVGPVWATPSKPDAGGSIGLEGLAAVCAATSLPVIAIGGVDPGNVGYCLRAGAAGVAVIRAARQSAAVLAAMEATGGPEAQATGREPEADPHSRARADPSS